MEYVKFLAYNTTKTEVYSIDVQFHRIQNDNLDEARCTSWVVQ